MSAPSDRSARDAAVTISRTSEFDGDRVRIQIHSDRAGFIICVELTLEEYARALTAEHDVACRLIRCNLSNA